MVAHVRGRRTNVRVTDPSDNDLKNTSTHKIIPIGDSFSLTRSHRMNLICQAGDGKADEAHFRYEPANPLGGVFAPEQPAQLPPHLGVRGGVIRFWATKSEICKNFPCWASSWSDSYADFCQWGIGFSRNNRPGAGHRRSRLSLRATVGRFSKHLASLCSCFSMLPVGSAKIHSEFHSEVLEHGSQ